MSNLGDMVVRIVGDNNQLDKSITTSQQKLKAFGDSAARIGGALSRSLTLPILAVGAGFVKAATDAEETNSKFNTVFREQADSVRDWAETYSDEVGRSTVENLGFLSGVQDLFVPLGMARDEAAEFAKGVVELSTDLGSFNNMRTADVMRDIQSTLVGNYETTRKYGVVLSAAIIEQEAFNMGLITQKDELTPLIKAQVSYQLLIQGTADAQGDAARTAGSTANQFKALKAEVIDLAVAFGQEMLPTVNNMVDGIRNAVKWFTDLDEGTKRMILRIGGVTAAIGPLLLVLGKIPATLESVKIGLAFLTANPIILGLTAIAAGITAIALATSESRRDLREYNELVTNTAAAILGLDLAQQQQRRNQIAADALTAQIEQLQVLREISALNRERAETEAEFAEIQNMTTQEQDFANRALEAYDVDIRSMNETLQVYIDRENTLNEAISVLDESLEDARTSTIAITTDITITTGAVEDLTDGTDDLTEALEKHIKAHDKYVQSLRDERELTQQVAEEKMVGYILSQQVAEGYIDEAKARDISKRAADELRAANEEAHDLQRAINVRLAEKGLISKENEEARLAAAEAEGAGLTGSLDMYQQYYDARVAAHEDTITKEKEQLEEFLGWYEDNYIGRIIDSTQALVSALVDFANTRADAEIAALDETLMSEEAYDAAVRAIQRDQAEREKKLGIFSAVIDTAQAIIGFLADPGGLAGVVLSVLAGVTGAAQIAAISAAPLPALAAGGIVTGPTPAMVGEGGQPEIIFPLDQLGNFLSQRGDFNDMGGGDMHIVVNLEGQPILDTITKAARDGRVLIDARAVVA